MSMTIMCPKENEEVNIKSIFGTKFDGLKLGRRIGLPTINILLDLPIKCGIYEAKSYHGPATVIVGKNDKRRAFVNFMIFKPEIDEYDRFEFWDLKRVINKDSEFVNTYNSGCC